MERRRDREPIPLIDLGEELGPSPRVGRAWVRASPTGVGASVTAPAAVAGHGGPQHTPRAARHAGDVVVPVLGHVTAAGSHSCYPRYELRGADNQKASFGIVSLGFAAAGGMEGLRAAAAEEAGALPGNF